MAHNVALVGNPNCGKTTLFNELTGSNQYVGNWSGVTVEKKIGRAKWGNCNINIVDLPGIYSLSPYTMEEVIARDYIINEQPDVLINIIDGTNIERNMYLTIQLLELGIPMVVAVNMMDDVKARGDFIDCKGLASDLGIPVIPIVARKRENINYLLEVCEYIAHNKIKQEHNIKYDFNTQLGIDQISEIIRNYNVGNQYKFYSSKLLEGDKSIAEILKISVQDKSKIEKIIDDYEKLSVYGDRETMLADARYKFITGLVEKHVTKGNKHIDLTVSDKIDIIVTNRFLAIPIFLIIIFGVFSITFGKVGMYLKHIINFIIEKYISLPVEQILQTNNMPAWTHGLLVDAVIGGVGSVLEFLPQIMILFLFLSILEDSGYMARAAFIMDRLLHKLGLTGKSFIPMLMGFGCTTPAVMASRIMENVNDKRLTIMLIPFMSCGARLVVYGLFASIFFPNHQGLVIFSLYILGLVVAILSGLALKHTVFKSANPNFVMELPPYRFPTGKTILLHMWDKCKGFLVKAGTIIFSMCILVWILSNFNFLLNPVTDSSQSMLGKIGAIIAPIFTPLGFGNWESSVALLTGIVSKESVASSIAVIYHSYNNDLSQILPKVFSKASAYSFMVFTLLYVPCVSAFISMKKEMGSWKWAIGTATMEIGIAYLFSMIAYQILKNFL